MKTFLLASLIGIAAGLAGALLGVGGGIIMVPSFIAFLGLEQKQAVATSLAVIVITAVMGTGNHLFHKSGLIDWRIVALTAGGAALAAWFGSDLMRTLSNQHLTRAFGVVLLVVGVKMIWK